MKVKEFQKVVLLGPTFDNHLTFKDHINIRCSGANYKIHVSGRIRKYLTLEKVKLLYNAFVNSQFNLFVPNAPFLYNLKTLENLLMFSGDRERVHWERMG